MQFRVSVVALGMALLVGGCSQFRQTTKEEYNDDSRRARVLRTTGARADSGLVIFGTDRNGRSEEAAGGGSGLSVNAYLWRATLDTLSFMPLASADPFGGTIITDWYTPAGTPGERLRVQAYLLGRQLRSDGVKVQVFRQRLENGNWMDTPVSNATSSELEDKVLSRARELRSQSAAR